ncbi:LysR family transcriptional regulator [Ornithinimicrobium cerasi]|uniref:DNA-binding transcriptional regulator, LysR family n=1 Tax=Ornithinimicrobium cerasi TaxID=2248773 RepID=A0A285VB11_9MICO|nr:LysR family transcriptional regulator [Ornithinimicrobium cerasi]SOC51193.1 DNA-binding transcriptional regulator, LysR family [Ornithinimicrobium cerasi]
MQLYQLRAFLALAQDLNFRRAAARLCESQPALTAQIRDLERHLGITLFDRGRSGTQLTEDGAALIPLARAALQATAQIEAAAHHGIGYHHILNIGVMPLGADQQRYRVLSAFHEVHPDVDLRLTMVDYADALPWLRDQVIDLLWAIGPFGDEDGVVLTVGAVPVVALMPVHHPRALCQKVEAGWLATHLRIAPPVGMGRAFAHFWTLQDAGAPPLETLERFSRGGVRMLLCELQRSGAVAPWPAVVPVSGPLLTQPLAPLIMAPVQILTPHRPRGIACEFVQMAADLTFAI